MRCSEGTEGSWSHKVSFCTVKWAPVRPLWQETPRGTEWLWHGKEFHNLKVPDFFIKTYLTDITPWGGIVPASIKEVSSPSDHKQRIFRKGCQPTGGNKPGLSDMKTQRFYGKFLYKILIRTSDNSFFTWNVICRKL